MRKILFAIVAFIITINIYAQFEEVDYNAFISETQRSISGNNEIRIVWWLPVEFWKITFAQDNSMSAEQISKFTNTLSKYTLCAIVDGEIGSFGGVTYTPIEEIEKNLTIIGNNGKTVTPLKRSNLDDDVQNLLLILNPVLKNMMGKLGENMHFFVFDDYTKKGERICDPYEKGKITFTLFDNEYTWLTPLGTLLKKKKCPIDGDLMNGAWEYCPYHGNKLEETK